MSATNATATISLPLFIGTDKPAWLTDWNGAMNTIDSAIATLQTAESGTATSLAALSQSVEALSGTVSQHTTALTTISTAVSGNTGSINTINSLIGNGTPTTTDQTIIGAINELHAEIGGGTTISVPAADVTYDNTASGLTADDVQEAIDEIVAAIPSVTSTSEVKRGTLATGQTSVALTFTDQTIGANTLVDVYTDDISVVPTAVSISGQVVTLTFDAQASAVAVAVKVQN